jgi:hypothetical protein
MSAMHSDLHGLLQRALHEARLRDAAAERAVAAGRAAPRARREVAVARWALRLMTGPAAAARRRPVRRARG